MAINFPSSPSLNQQYNVGTRTWIWNGSAWNLSSVIGASGYSGFSGESGTSGYSGYSGESGASGYSGFSGESGTSGYSGYSGESGASGYSGFSGYSGQDGIIGVDGASGYSGFSGYSGESGASGYSGFSGYSGESGASGYSGFSGKLPSWALKTANYTASDNDRIIADTSSSSFAITLPTSPSTGTYVVITDGNDWSTNNLVIDPNGSTIEGISDTLIINLKGVTVELIYSGTTWQVTATTGSQGPQGPQGPIGETGPQGASGYSGYSGYSGITGSRYTFSETAPANAIEGDIWFDSNRGIQYVYIEDIDSSQWVELGLTINEGISGFSGYSGYSGYSGQDGLIGVDGESGYSGYSGISGYSGFSGESGSSGYSGISGYSGFSGATGVSPFTLIDSMATYAGVIESTTGGFKFPDGSTQITADGGPISVNATTVSNNYTMPANKNGISVGAMLIQPSYSITIPAGKKWVIL